MEKSQYELCIEVLRRLDKGGVLENTDIFYDPALSGAQIKTGNRS